MMDYSEKKDSLGSVKVPAEAYYGAQTQRAIANFEISSLTFSFVFLHALALIKAYAAQANHTSGLLDKAQAEAIQQAAKEVRDGKFDDQFPVDIFQTGSATSTNMNMNEVLATRANELLTGSKASLAPVHPNDQVNLGQSSNDVIPTAIHVAAVGEIKSGLIPNLRLLQAALRRKALAFKTIKKIGRTHLQDAVPIYLGDEFGGYARQVEWAIQRLDYCLEGLSELALGGTAVGNGLNAHPQFAPRVIAQLSAEMNHPFCEAANHFEAQSARDAAVETSGTLKTIAVSLTKIANDIRWLGSGPRCGIGEIGLPTLQPGSSIMPGKVNPVIPEMVIQVAAQVIGNDAAITYGGQGGVWELNTMMPIIAHNLLQSIKLLRNAAVTFAEKCIDGIQANPAQCEANIEKSLALATHLVPQIGYDRAAEIAKKAHATGKHIRQIVLEEQLMSEEALQALFDAI